MRPASPPNYEQAPVHSAESAATTFGDEERPAVGTEVRDVSVLCEALSAAEKAGKGKGPDKAGDMKLHGILPDGGSGPAASAKG